MHVIGNAKPPTQYLFGEGIVYEFNPDTADRWPVTYLRRRCRKIVSTAGAVQAGRMQTLVYEVRCDGDVYRIEEDDAGHEQERVKVPEGHAEWWWAYNAVLAIRERLRLPRSQWKHSIPPDCIAWGTRKSTGTADVKSPVRRKT